MKIRNGFVSNSSSSSFLVLSDNEKFLSNCDFGWIVNPEDVDYSEHVLNSIKENLGEKMVEKVKNKEFGVYELDLPYEMCENTSSIEYLLKMFGAAHIIDLEN